MKKIVSLLVLCVMVFTQCSDSNVHEAQTFKRIDDRGYHYETNETTTKPTTSTKTVHNNKSVVFEKKIFTFGTDMKMYDSSKKRIGVVEEKIFNLTSTFNYYDENKKFIARAHEQFFTLGTKIDITDAHGNKIGSVEQELLESMFSFYSIYKIYDGNHKVIAKSDKLDLFSSHVYIRGNGINIDLHQRVFTLFDTWDMEIDGEIDERLVYFIPGFIASSQSEHDDE